MCSLLPQDAGQGHVFAHWDKCTPSELAQLVSQLQHIDLAKAGAVFTRSLADHTAGASSKGTIEPVKADDSVAGADPAALQRWRARGLAVAAAGWGLYKGCTSCMQLTHLIA